MKKLLIRNCDVLQIDGNGPRVEPSMDIYIDGERIAKISDHKASVETLPETEIIDGSGLLAIPGLMNTHAHVPMVLFRGLAEDVSVQAWFNDYIFPLESGLTPEDVYWGAMLGMAEMIRAGVTSVADHYFYMDDVARAVTDSGMRANLVWAVFGHEGTEKLDRSCEFVERWQGKADGRITTWLGPHAPYTCPADFLRLAAQRARDLNVGIHIHVSETAEQVQLSLEQHGITPVQMLAETSVLEVPTILGHCLFPTDADIKLLASAKTGVAHAPKTYMKLGMGTAPLPRYREAGIPIGLATDGVVSSNTLDILEQMRLMALTQKDAAGDSTTMPLADVLETAFHGSAKVLGKSDELGDLAPGKLADITLIRQDQPGVFPCFNPAANLVYSASSRDVDTVICNGKTLMLHNKLLTINLDQVKREVSARLDRLNRRDPNRRIATYPG
jgi:5-methylthioadenosine/S-adenosylhomocysteine deaminase